MRAARLYRPGDLRIEETERPKPEPGQVLVKVHAAGICGSDIPRIMSTGTYHFPCTPGHEFSGEIAECGSLVTKFSAGDRVVITPLMPCRRCEMCRQGFYGQCEVYDFLGSRRDGGFAEYAAVPEDNLLLLPETVSYREAALIEPAAVTLHGLNKLGLAKEGTAAVFGCGAIGLLAVSQMKLLGAGKVIAVDIDHEKLKLAQKMGADVTIHSLEEDPVERIRQIFKDGVHAAVETAGTPVTQEQCIRAVKSQGEVLFLGTAHRDVVFPAKTFERIVRREIRMTGSWNSYSAPYPGREWTDIIRYLKEGRLSFEPLITHVFPLDRMPEIVKDMAERRFPYTKVLFEMTEG